MLMFSAQESILFDEDVYNKYTRSVIKKLAKELDVLLHEDGIWEFMKMVEKIVPGLGCEKRRETAEILLGTYKDYICEIITGKRSGDEDVPWLDADMNPLEWDQLYVDEHGAEGYPTWGVDNVYFVDRYDAECVRPLTDCGRFFDGYSNRVQLFKKIGEHREKPRRFYKSKNPNVLQALAILGGAIERAEQDQAERHSPPSRRRDKRKARRIMKTAEYLKNT